MNELWSRRELPVYLAIGLLIVVTVLAYANAWPDVLVHDDKYFVGAPHQADWADLPRFFTEDLWAATGRIQLANATHYYSEPGKECCILPRKPWIYYTEAELELVQHELLGARAVALPAMAPVVQGPLGSHLSSRKGP